MNSSRITGHSSLITNYPKVSIIIINWNGLQDTTECLDSLKKITYPNYEVIVVDNASSGDDVRILKEKFGDYIHVIANDQNYGFPAACNIAMKYALSKGTDYMLLLNNDTVVDPEFLSRLVEIAECDSSIGIVGSKILYYHQPNKIQAAGGRIIWWLGWIYNYGEEEDVGQYEQVAERDIIWGTSFLMKKMVLDKISFMDPYFFLGVEEYDYCTRAKRAGFKLVYVPQSKVWHKSAVSRAKASQFPETQRLLKKQGGRGDYKYYYRLFRTHCPPVLFIFPFLCCMVRMSRLGKLVGCISRRDWQAIKRGIVKGG